MTWCEHIDLENACKLEVHYKHGVKSVIEPRFFFCPICGTPKPKEVTLEEKFDHILSGFASRLNENAYCRYKNTRPLEIGLDRQTTLAKLIAIAKDHFKENKI